MGKNKYIETPEKMWELFKEYRTHEKGSPILVKDWVGKDGDEVCREKETPLTMEGFECYLFEKEIIGDLGDYFSNKNNAYTDYSTICRAIRMSIRHDQIRGGMAQIYNPSITQRLNGLVDKTAADDTKEITIKVKYEKKDKPE